jgi:uncharacterized protein YlxW (UPF0749 family)
MNKSNIELKIKEKALLDLEVELQSLSDKRDKLSNQRYRLEEEIRELRMASVEINPQNILLYPCFHWTDSGVDKIKAFLSDFKFLKLYGEDRQTNQFCFSINQSSETVDQLVKEVKTFLPFLKPHSFEYVESRQGTIESFSLKSFYMTTPETAKTGERLILGISDSGKGVVLLKSYARSMELKNAQNWETLIPFVLEKLAGNKDE